MPWAASLAGADLHASYLLSRWVFLRALGLIGLVAFLSFWTQAHGLVGRHGILPLIGYLQAVKAQTGFARYWQWPTVFWLNSSDAALHVVCALGSTASLMLAVGIAPAASLAALALLYLSVTVAGQDFLAFQWDVLLIETCFLSVFLAPAGWLPNLAREPAVPPAARILLWWLLFRLMIESGVVKLTCGDPTWRHLTALNYHYFTQPLPTWIAWYAHQLPSWFQRLSVAVTLAIEIGLPLLIFTWRPLRLTACAGFVLFNVLIMATGNYNFFNLLAIALSLLLLDDAFWCRLFPPGLLDALGYAPDGHSAPAAWHSWLTLAVAGYFFAVGAVQILAELAPRPPAWRALSYRLNVLQPLRALNSYGLFRVMTTRRLEIVIEGSQDGRVWRGYEFRHKPGDPRRRPDFVEPHQPRLDWQMWFAALSSFEAERWFQSLLVRLLEGRPEVLRLFRSDPFAGQAPRFVRARLYEYEFTSPAERRKTGAWWNRRHAGDYVRPVSLADT